MPEWTKLNQALTKEETLELNYLTVDQMVVVFHNWAQEKFHLMHEASEPVKIKEHQAPVTTESITHLNKLR